jgi:hypothetical protein
MKPECLVKAVVLAEKGAHLLIATGAFEGHPHVAPAARLELSADRENIAVEAWFCPETLENLRENGKVDLVVWDAILDNGYQLLGKCRGIEDLALLNGFDVLQPEKSGLPQVERRIRIQVEKVLPFQRGSHTDREEC